MPEIPEIERYKHLIKDKGLDTKVIEIKILDEDVISNSESQEIRDILKDSELKKVERIGKYLCISTDNSQSLEWHFGMTGLPYFFTKENKPDYTRVLLTFESDLKLAFVDARKLGKMCVVKNKDEVISKHHLGVDALSVSAEKFKEVFSQSTAMAKTGLMNQSNICGIGNLYSDEILFQAKIYPKTKLKDLEESKLEELYSTMKSVLTESIKIVGKQGNTSHYHESGNDFPDDFLIAHRKKGGNCPDCGGEVKNMKIGGRTCYYCLRCQTRE